MPELSSKAMQRIGTVSVYPMHTRKTAANPINFTLCDLRLLFKLAREEKPNLEG